MKIYLVKVSEHVAHEFSVKAKNKEEAEKKFRTMVNKGLVDWSYGDYVNYFVEDIVEDSEEVR